MCKNIYQLYIFFNKLINGDFFKWFVVVWIEFRDVVGKIYNFVVFVVMYLQFRLSVFYWFGSVIVGIEFFGIFCFIDWICLSIYIFLCGLLILFFSLLFDLFLVVLSCLGKVRVICIYFYIYVYKVSYCFCFIFFSCFYFMGNGILYVFFMYVRIIQYCFFVMYIDQFYRIICVRNVGYSDRDDFYFL